MRTSPYKEQGERGFSLVELMVGIAVGLIALLIMSQVIAIQSSQKQTTASGSNAQTAGAIALFALERDARMAGFGVNGAPLLGCTVNGYFQGESSGEAFQFSFVPVRIDAGTNTDTLTISYGTSDGNLSPARITQAHAGDTADYQLDNRFGFHLGNFVIVAQDGVDPDNNGSNDCALAQVTALPSSSGNINNISSNGNSYTDPRTGETAAASFNKPGGPGIAYDTGALVYNMGTPVSRTYAVDTANAQLTVQDNISTGAAQSIAEGIVALRAQYGKDTDRDGSVDIYDTTTPTTAAEWTQVIALRVAVVTRSAKRETATVSPASIKLWPDLTLASGETADGPTLSLSAEQRLYRYRVFQTLVPLRNLIWKIPENS